MAGAYDGAPEDTHIVAFITFKFRRARIRDLFETVRTLQGLPSRRVEINIVTETDADADIGVLARLFDKLHGERYPIRFMSRPDMTSRPRMLGWAHKASLRDLATARPEVTHVLYMEEDIHFCPVNLAYLCRARRELAEHGLVPGFIRYEFNETVGDIFTADQQGRQSWRARRQVRAGGRTFVELDVPYCAMHLLDRALLVEYVASPSFDPALRTGVIGWGEPERAAMGLVWENPPAGHRSRVVVPLRDGTKTPHHDAWVYHAPSNYTNDDRPGPNWILGKTRMDDIFLDDA